MHKSLTISSAGHGCYMLQRVVLTHRESPKYSGEVWWLTCRGVLWILVTCSRTTPWPICGWWAGLRAHLDFKNSQTSLYHIQSTVITSKLLYLWQLRSVHTQKKCCMTLYECMGVHTKTLMASAIVVCVKLPETCKTFACTRRHMMAVDHMIGDPCSIDFQYLFKWTRRNICE